MRLPPEMSLTACGSRPLLDAVRQALADEGRAPSRRRVHDWIAAGLVRVDGRPVHDPAFVPPPEGRLDLVPQAADEAPPPDASGDARNAAPLPLLHLDRHLLVVEAETPSFDAMEERVDGCLRAAAWHGPRPDVQIVPAWLPGSTGLVVAALTPTAGTALARAFEEGTARTEVLALVGTVPEGEDVRWRSSASGGRVVALAARGPREAAARLEAAGSAPLATVTPPHPPAPAVHVVRVTLAHPRHGRPLAWEVAPPPWAA